MDHKLYLSDPGIYKKGVHFYHNGSNKLVNDLKILHRLSSFKVPPAWNNVWYASNKKCHIQVHGTDQSGKKQYILSSSWVNNAKFEKYTRMKKFIRNLPAFKRHVKLAKNENFNSKESLMKLLFNLLIDTHIRVGNEIYAQSNKTYGLTTLRQKHFDGSSFVFTGKSKIKHSISIPEEYIVYLKKLVLSDKSKFLFWYGNNQTIDSEELNIYLKENMGQDYTCKDFRTYSANILFIKAFLKNIKKGNNVKKIILKSIDSAAEFLGHSRNISRKSYISDNLLNYCLTMSPEVLAGESTSGLVSKIWES